MKISLRVYTESQASVSAVIQSFDVNESLDASELREILRAKALVIWNGYACQGPEIKSGKLEADKTYHVIANNRERTRKALLTLSKISRL